MPSRRRMLISFRRIRELLQLPDNNFDWSGWDDANDALAEIDAYTEAIQKGHFPIGAQILFLPTGPLQETSLSSGWGKEFVDIANEFDSAFAADADCHCYLEPDSLILESELGMDERFAEISLLRCPACAQQWVRYFYEQEAFSKSGRWYLGAVDGQVSGSTAKLALENAVEYWQGGSYFDGKESLSSGPILSL